MKKLMFALIAGVAVSAAQAVDVFADGDGFENKAVDTPATNVNTKFAYIASDTSGDGSAVKAYDAEVTAYAGDRNAAFVGANNNYLELNTDGGTLYRSILEPAGVNQVGPATNITSSFFIDTLVKFTACDSAQEIDSSAKLAIWLQVSGDNEEYTNLVVRANKMKLTFEDEVLDSGTAEDELYTISGSYNADQWYRLTVEDLGNVFNSSEGLGATGFRIKIDGNAVSAANGNVAVTLADGSSAAGLLDGIAANDTFAAGLTNGSIFLSLQDDNLSTVTYNSTLQAVGFFGTGGVDDILFTSLDPFWTAPSTLDFTLTLGDNITSVTYAIGENAPVTVTDDATFQVAPGAEISLSITPATSTWRTYAATVTPDANVTVNGNTVTVRTIEQTDDNQLTAGATVSATDTATTLVDGDVTGQFLSAKGITNEGLLAGLAGNASGYRSFLTWAENNSYDLARVNGAVNAYTRFSNNWPIEMEVYVGGNAGVTSYAASTNNGAAFNDQTASVTGIKYTVDAGDTLTLDNFVFADAGENQAYLLDGAAASWTYGASAATGLASLTVGSESNSVEFVTDPRVRSAKVSLATVEVDTRTPVAQIGETQYYTLKDAIDAATAGQTVAVLADCTVTEPITFNYGITVSNDYTVSISANYAFRIANGTSTPVTMEGSGSYVWVSGSGSPIIIGSNELKSDYAINEYYKGSVVMNSGTLTSTGATAKSGNLVKLEDGTFVMNGGTINGGTRGVKADSEGNNATSVLTINGGTIVNTNSAAVAASTKPGGSSTVIVNGGTFSGKFDGTGMVTIPGTSTAQFDRNQTAFCVADYKTVLDNGWWVVTPKVYYTAISLNKAETSLVTNTTETLTATLTPASVADDSVTWTTSDATVATVAGGVVTAVGAGTAVITAACEKVFATCTVTVTAPEPTPELPVIPAGGETAEYASAEAAAEVAAAVNASEEAKAKAITPPASVAEGDKSTYYSYVQAVTAGNKVTVGFTTAGEAAARASANAATADADFSAAISDAAAAGASGSGTASVSSEPGLYYSIMSTGSLSTEMTEGTRVPGTGGKINLTVPNKGAAGFYKVKVSPRAAD